MVNIPHSSFWTGKKGPRNIGLLLPLHFRNCEEVEWAEKTNPAGNYMIKVNNKNTRIRCEIDNFEDIKHLILVLLLLTLSR